MTSERAKAIGRIAVNNAKEDGCLSFYILCDVYHQAIVEHYASEEVERSQWLTAKPDGVVVQHQFLSRVGTDNWINIKPEEVEQAHQEGFETRELYATEQELT